MCKLFLVTSGPSNFWGSNFRDLANLSTDYQIWTHSTPNLRCARVLRGKKRQIRQWFFNLKTLSSERSTAKFVSLRDRPISALISDPWNLKSRYTQSETQILKLSWKLLETPCACVTICQTKNVCIFMSHSFKNV